MNRRHTEGRRARIGFFAAACGALLALSPSAFAQQANCGTFEGQTLLPITQGSVTATPTITSPCIGCSVANPQLAINANIVDDYATMTRGLGLFGGVSLRIRSPNALFAARRSAGVIISAPPEVLAADLLAQVEVQTYLNGVARDTTSEAPGLLAPLLDLNLLTLLPGENKHLLAFRTNNSFNEIELRLPSTVTLQTDVQMYAACVGPAATGDVDLDTIPDNTDNCPVTPNTNQLDSDGDGVGNLCDNCPAAGAANSNANQADLDRDGQGDACDTDDDGDGDLDTADNCPTVANPNQENSNNDNVGDACTVVPLDGDGDGRPDSTDNCPTVANAGQADTDGDGIGDACDNPDNVSCGTNGAHKFRPLLLPNASTLAVIEQICLLCTINDQDNAISPNPNDYATLYRPVGALTGTAALRVRSTNTVFPAGRQAALIIEDPADLLSAEVLPQLQINTYLGSAQRQTNQVEVGLLPPLLDLDLLELFGEGGRKLLVINTSQSFDGLELKLPSTVTALSEVRLYNACVEIPAVNPPDPPEPPSDCPPVISPAPPGYCTIDSDGDGRVNEIDNCPATANANQADTDNDGRGNVCDATPNGPDPDGDGVGRAIDNCPNVSNADQADSDNDGIGNVCEAAAQQDTDGDGDTNNVDNCPNNSNANQADTDNDGIGNVCDTTPNGPDPDGDGIGSAVDNCPNVRNSNQADTDGDGIGNACEAAAATDTDGDGVNNSLDNCPTNSNANQADSDNDGIGNVCESTASTDTDGDGVPNNVDNCPTISNANQADSDNDGIGNACENVSPTDSDGDGVANNVDNCPNVSNANQADSDGDGIGNACENNSTTDTDGDGVANNVDNCPNVSNASQTDSDGDGIGNACDTSSGPDSDGDGTPNDVDNCPTVRNADQADSDDDGVGDVCDAQTGPDDDNDGIDNSRDNCPTIANGGQADSDGDGLGDACDSLSNGPDTDGDGIPDSLDNCPTVASTNQADNDGDGVGNVCDSTPGTTPGTEDRVPDAFQFSRQIGVPVNSELTTEFVRITGINAPATITVSGGGGSYSIDNGAFTTAAGTILNGQLVRVRHMSSSVYGRTTQTAVTIGGVSGRFESITTTAAPAGNTDDDNGGAMGGLWLLAAAALWRRRGALRLR